MVEKANSHAVSKYHLDAIEMAYTFVQQRKDPSSTVACKLDTKRAENVRRNRQILDCVIRSVMLCGQQCLPLRGDHEQFGADGNPGNFLAVLHFLAVYYPVLDQHLKSPAMQNAKMTSPRIQNEVIDVMAQHFIVSQLVKEVKEAKFFSVMADEVTSHNTEVLSICVRFVDQYSRIREEFLSFSKVPRITGEVLAQEIKDVLQSKGLELEKIRGQGYDGASSMSSAACGVQARIKAVSPKAVYVHCNSHVLNLVIARSCSLIAVKSMIDKLKAVCMFFYNSPKRTEALKAIVTAKFNSCDRRKVLLDLCRTRWSARQEAYSHFYQAYIPLVEVFEVMAQGLHHETYPEIKRMYADWDSKTKSDANSLLHSITDFSFLVTFVLVYKYLSHLHGVTILLQKTSLDVLQAYSMVCRFFVFTCMFITYFCKCLD